MENQLISIIVPTYNVKPYLQQCVDSLLRQTYKPIEILLIDDGSTDGSGELCEQFSKAHSVISVFHKKNGGLSSARNFGIDHANGEILAFIDSDDFVADDMIQVLAYDMKENHARMSACNHYLFFENRPAESCVPKYQCSTILKNNDVSFGIYDDFSAWNKLYRKELFEKIRFPEGKLYEDARTTYKLADICNTVTYNPKPLYYYRQRSSSIMGTFSTKNFIDRVNVWNEIIKFFQSKFTEEQISILYTRKNKLVVELLCSIVASGKVFKEKAIINKLVKELNNDVLKSSDISKRNKLIIALLKVFS